MEASRENLQERIKRGDTTVLRDIVDTLYSRTEVPAKKKTVVAPEVPPVADTSSDSQVFWDSILSKPTEFPPSEHGHTILQVQDLREELDARITVETDPTVPAHVKDITQADIDIWNTPSAPGGIQIAGVTGGALGDLVYVAGVQPGDVSYEDIHGITYKCVQMPDGNKWMAENYRKLVSYVSEPGGPPPDSYTGNVPDYGYLYRRDLAEDFRNNPVINGWQFPTRADWLALAESCGGLSVAGGRLKTAGTTRWAAPNTGGADDYGFNAVGAGYHTPFYSVEGFRTNGVYWCADFDTVPGGKHCVGFTTGSAAMTDGSGLTGYRDDAAIMAVSIRWKKASSLVSEELRVPAFSVRLFDDSAFLTEAQVFDVPAQEIPVPGYDQRYYLCAQRSGDTVTLVSVPQADAYTINMSNIVPLWRFEIHGTDLHQISYDNMGDGLPNKQEFAQLRTEPYRMAVEGGFAVTLGAGRSLTMTGAEVFFGHHRISVLAFDSATDKTHLFFHTAGVWDDVEFDGGWAWPNTQYDDGTNLVTMGDNKWSALYVYRSIGDDKELFVVYAQSEANTLESARLIGIPPTPALVQWHSMLVGRILFQKSSATGIFEPYQPATFVRAEAPSLALNDLTDVDTVGAIAGNVPILGGDGIWRPGVPVASFVGGRQTTVNTDLSWVAQWECVIYSPSYDKIYAGSTSADYGLGTQHIAVTSDMKTWTYLNVPIRVYAIADNGSGILVCSGDVGTTGYRSTDGVNWSAVTIGISATALAWDAAAGVFIAVSDATDQVRISSDGITWSNGVVLTAFDGGWRRLSVGKHTGKVYVSAYMNAGARTDIIGVISSGGTAFSAFTHPSAPSVYGVVELSATKIVAGTKNGAASTFFISNDAGATWALGGEGSDPKIHAMAQSDSCIVAIAYGNPSDATMRILWSEDGVTWTYIPYRPYDRNFTGIAYFPKYDAFIITIGASSSVPYVSRGIILRV